MARRSYEAEGITISYDSDLCQQSHECMKGLPGVFDTEARPWIQPQNASPAEVERQVRLCPSGALRVGDGGDATRLFSAAWRVLEGWEKPLLTAYGKADPVLGWADKLFQLYVPGAKGQPHIEFEDGGHFIQEQYPDELVEAITGLAAGL